MSNQRIVDIVIPLSKTHGRFEDGTILVPNACVHDPVFDLKLIEGSSNREEAQPFFLSDRLTNIAWVFLDKRASRIYIRLRHPLFLLWQEDKGHEPPLAHCILSQDPEITLKFDPESGKVKETKSEINLLRRELWQQKEKIAQQQEEIDRLQVIPQGVCCKHE